MCPHKTKNTSKNPVFAHITGNSMSKNNMSYICFEHLRASSIHKLSR